MPPMRQGGGVGQREADGLRQLYSHYPLSSISPTGEHHLPTEKSKKVPYKLATLLYYGYTYGMHYPLPLQRPFTCDPAAVWAEEVNASPHDGWNPSVVQPSYLAQR